MNCVKLHTVNRQGGNAYRQTQPTFADLLWSELSFFEPWMDEGDCLLLFLVNEKSSPIHSSSAIPETFDWMLHQCSGIPELCSYSHPHPTRPSFQTASVKLL